MGRQLMLKQIILFYNTVLGWNLIKMWAYTCFQLLERSSPKGVSWDRTNGTINRILPFILYFHLVFIISNASTDNSVLKQSFQMKTDRNGSLHRFSTPRTVFAQRGLLGSNKLYHKSKSTSHLGLSISLYHQ